MIGSRALFMPTIVPRPVLYALLAFSTLSACSPATEVREEPTAEQQVFSDEERRIARALSIGNRSAVDDAESPYARALLCRHGMDVLAERFQEATGLSEQQQQGIVQAQAYFDEQLRGFAQGEGKSDAELDEDLQQTALDNDDPAQTARIAIGCLQRLQDGG